MVRLAIEQLAVDPPPPYFTSLAVAPVRFMKVAGGRAALHHGCTQLGIDDYWGALDWWACEQPERALDAQTRFDMYCRDCGQRWLEFEASPLSLKGPVHAGDLGQLVLEVLPIGDAKTCPECNTALLTADGTRLVTRTGSDGIELWECPDCHTTWKKEFGPGPTP